MNIKDLKLLNKQQTQTETQLEKPEIKKLKPQQENGLADAIAQAIILANKSNQEMLDIKREQEIARQNEALSDRSGIASLSFKQLMQKEIEEGRFTLFTYYKDLAKKHGSKTSLNISGYKMDFVVNKTTKIPNVLLQHVQLKFGGLEVSDGAIRTVDGAVDIANRVPLDAATQEQISNAMSALLQGKK